MDNADIAKKKFRGDCFATNVVGVQIEKAEVNYALCKLPIEERHLNADGFIMGGAIFTLADFAFALASNIENNTTVSLTGTIQFLRAAIGPILYAEAKMIKDGKRICFYEIIVTDDKGEIVATLTSTGFRKQE